MFEELHVLGATTFPHLGLYILCKTCQLKHKICSKCDVDKPSVPRFWHKRRNGKHGFHSWCRECLNERNMTNHRERRKKHRKSNPALEQT